MRTLVPLASIQANSKKLLTDVFVKGDKYVRTGDLLTLDRQGYYRFVDRIGDTFRYESTADIMAVVWRARTLTPAGVGCGQPVLAPGSG